jgi:hypothetical protein
MISIVGFGRPKFGGAAVKKSDESSKPNKTAKKPKTCPECGQTIK